MRIGIDARSVGAKICGVSRSAICMLQALSSLDKTNEYIVYTDLLDAMPVTGDNFKIYKTECSRMNPIYDIKLYYILKRDKLDIYHVFHSWLPEFIPSGVKSIVTIHDIFSITDPNFFSHRRPLHKILQAYFFYMTRRTIIKADAIVTVSTYCKNEIVNKFALNDKRIEVIYNASGVDTSSKAGHVLHKLVNGEYFFYLGNFRSYKNVETLIRGFAFFHSEFKKKNILLVIAGNDYSEHMKTLAERLNVGEQIVFIHRPKDEEIDNLYRNASAFIFPSLYEGFGIPPLEAMGYGIPVIISDADALVETSGSASIIFDRNSPTDLALAMNRVLEDEELRNSLILRGFENASKYNWNQSASDLIRLYQTIGKGSEV